MYNAHMAMIQANAWECDVCGYIWLKVSGRVPTHCAKKSCHSRQWNSGRKVDDRGGVTRFAPDPDRPVVGTVVPAPKIAEAAAENSRPTPSDMTWADYDASAGKPDEVEGPEVIPESERCQYSEFDRETGETYRCALRVHDRKIRHQKGERV